MDNTYYEMIFKRKSFHLFGNTGNESITDEEIREIEDIFPTFTPLCPEIKTQIKIVPTDKTSCRRGAEYCILLFSEKKDGYLQNVGYLGEQLDLYLVSKNIGTLWLGLGKTDETADDNLDFVIMLAIKKIADSTKFRKDMFKAKRKTADEIWSGDFIDGVTDIVRFAPSACNTQPWFVERDNGILRVYRYQKHGKRGIMPAAKVSFYNKIDIGIFLCFTDICLMQNNIAFTKTVFPDIRKSDEFYLNAEYTLSER